LLLTNVSRSLRYEAIESEMNRLVTPPTCPTLQWREWANPHAGHHEGALQKVFVFFARLGAAEEVATKWSEQGYDAFWGGVVCALVQSGVPFGAMNLYPQNCPVEDRFVLYVCDMPSHFLQELQSAMPFIRHVENLHKQRCHLHFHSGEDLYAAIEKLGSMLQKLPRWSRTRWCTEPPEELTKWQTHCFAEWYKGPRWHPKWDGLFDALRPFFSPD